jgi:L-fuculose-phosphate aldolase
MSTSFSPMTSAVKPATKAPEAGGAQSLMSALPVLSPRSEVALLARALYRAGYDDCTSSGHITYRQANETFLTLPDGLGWNEVRTSDVIRIDLDGHTVEGDGAARPPIILHLNLHRARPGCNVTVHHHPRFATVWSAAGRVPTAYDQRGALVSDDEVVVYNDYAGPVKFADAARTAVAGIGTANYALLRNHGVFIVGDSIAQAYTRSANFEWRCRQGWFAEAIEGTKPVPAAGAKNTRDHIEALGGAIPNLWPWAVRRELGKIEDVLS